MQPQTADHTNVETGYLALVDRWCMDELTENVFNARFHKLVGRIARLQRDDP